MARDSDSSDSSYSRYQPASGRQENFEESKKVMRREKNRLAAQKSRQRQTLKADTLHQESEHLEKENAALRKEIKQLNEELKYFSAVLRNHESLCSVMTSSNEEMVYPNHSFHQTLSNSPARLHL
ncbi:basic leucine zipper transcriptional factor ATF-like isoform X1 [Carcharodon carcharias]|uniref:basic leucine zipper transcriptional factor ATF-like isoform X1 n=1 Tax=Carcharodon carcharias TaxID=13397 RepID=UPI001B7E2C14|nr:basic leucine zipper transcriptional factor ATF-like isoform X1 [Carcharodon carcharias]